MSKQNEDEEAIGASPTRIADPGLRMEAKKAFVWAIVIGGIALFVLLSQSLLVIFGALVFAAMLDGGARLLGRVLPIGRSLRVVLTMLLVAAFFGWLFYFAGTTIASEAATLPQILTEQLGRLAEWAEARGIAIDPNNVQQMASQLSSGIGTVTRAVGGVIGGLTTLLLIVIIGIYVAVEPRIYERGVEWIAWTEDRDYLRGTLDEMAFNLRRLMFGRLVGMVVEGIFTWAMLAFYGVPMAALLGLLTGILAFIPNIGAVISGLLMVLVGFSAGVDTGIYTIFVYFFVQTIDGYLLIPLIAKKTVDLAPALVLASQLILGVLFGLIGLALADPIMAMLKVALERRAKRNEENAPEAVQPAAEG